MARWDIDYEEVLKILEPQCRWSWGHISSVRCLIGPVITLRVHYGRHIQFNSNWGGPQGGEY